MQAQLQPAMETYLSGRTPDEFDMISAVRTILQSVGLGLKSAAFFDTHPYIIQALDKKPDVQRYFLNKFWTLQILMAPSVSIEERYCLIPNGTHADWIDLFQKKIVPFLLENELPGAL